MNYISKNWDLTPVLERLAEIPGTIDMAASGY